MRVTQPSRLLRLLVATIALNLLGTSSAHAEEADAPARTGYSCTSRCERISYEGDFSAENDEPAVATDDPRSALRGIAVGDSLRLDFGGEFRLRWESRTNGDFGQSARTHGAQQDYRWFLHSNIRFRDLFRVFVQGAFTHVEDQDGPFQPALENHGDLQQLFVDARVLGPQRPLTLRIGRQELGYGANRLVGSLDWLSNRRRFDAVKLMYHTRAWDVDAFLAKPVVTNRKSADDWNEQYDFFGVYASFKRIPHHTLDVYALGAHRTEDLVNPNGRSGDQSTYSLGSRLLGEIGGWDYDVEFTGQWGRWAGDPVRAWSWAIDGGYTFSDWPMQPRVGGGFDFTSGDDNPNDGTVRTFNQLFPFDHRCNGMQDLVGRQNSTRAYVGIDLWPVPKKFKSSAALTHFWLSEEADSLYNAGGVPLLREPLARSGVEVGMELDLWFEWKITAHSTLSAGYSHFFDDRFVHAVVRDDDPDLFILQYRYRF